MNFRPLQAHPMFLPAMAIMATLVALMVMAAHRPAPQLSLPTFGSHSDAGATNSSATRIPAGTIVPAAQLTQVQLATRAGDADAIVTTIDGQQVRLVLDADTRIIVPYNGQNVIAGPQSLEDGTSARIELVPGQQVRSGARIAQLTVAGAHSDAGSEA
jgi:hypothetical protein